MINLKPIKFRAFHERWQNKDTAPAAWNSGVSSWVMPAQTTGWSDTPYRNKARMEELAKLVAENALDVTDAAQENIDDFVYTMI